MTTNIEQAMASLETALALLTSDSFRDEVGKLPPSAMIYLHGVNASIKVALEKLGNV